MILPITSLPLSSYGLYRHNFTTTDGEATLSTIHSFLFQPIMHFIYIYIFYFNNIYITVTSTFLYICIILRQFQSCTLLKLCSFHIINVSLKITKLQYLCGCRWYNVVCRICTIQFVSAVCLRGRMYSLDIVQ
jgi:hypothetical protein